MDTLSSTVQTQMDALSSTLQTHMDALSHSYKFDLSLSWPFPESSQNMKSAASTSSIDLNLQAENGATNHPTEFKFSSIPEFFHIEKKPAVSGSTTNYTSDNHLWTMKLSSGMDPSKNFYFHNCHEKPVGIGSQTDSGFPGMDTMNLPSGVDASMSGWQGSPDFVIGHFYKRAQDILVACSAYMDGAQVGCLVKGGVQDVDAGDRSCSQYFKVALADYITVLVQAFSQIGAKDCEKFLSLVEKGSNLVSSPVPPMALNLFNAMNMQF
ncbi:putative ubiquitin-conjugating enzyme E2 26 [Camellia lanceoleosa]|uniref:Ubiquitin-conjugating enzyme E2 26 n=1 Tax=Camellia lanceoleosa TaxID=1840588 RepID=A0ACC0H6U6_9ERIC|nr:putative ubiquitin-conjugating enzyme E2 26 [Camellia lanceoleosa]